MGKSFYSDYVNHCLRFYARYANPVFHSEADKKNWKACDDALSEFSVKDRDTLLAVYKSRDTTADTVYAIAKDEGIEQDGIWKLLGDLERKVAKKRELL